MQLTSPHVRHLFWCIQSPSLARLNNIPSWEIDLNEQLKTWFTQLDQNPDQLQNYLNHHEHKLLGTYFECLFQFFFKHAPNWQLVAHNIQIIEDKQTLGELDIIAHHQANNRAKEEYHLELAVKFYLQHPDHTGLEANHWLGPQSRDRLDLKLNKLSQKQFPFLAHQSVKDALEKKGLPLPSQQRLILKGYLFSRWGQKSILPDQVNKRCLTGQWIHQSEIGRLTEKHAHWLLSLIHI